MLRICSSLGLVMLACAVAGADADDPKVLESRHGPVTARLSVVIADTADGAKVPVTMTVEVKGPATLEVDGVRLEDPVGGWDSSLSPPTTTGTEQRTWVQVIHLMVKKREACPLPAVSVRFRPTMTAKWERAEWTHILDRTAPGPALEPAPPLPSGPNWVPWAAAAGVVVILAIGALLIWRWRRPAQTLGPRERALRDLTALVDDDRDPLAFYDHLAQALRAFLAAQFGLPAGQRTTAELVSALGAVSELPAEQQERVHALLARCDAVRFGGHGCTPEEVQWAREEARQFIVKVS